MMRSFDAHWVFLCQVEYNAIVYKTDKKKYLVVRAKIHTNVQPVHNDSKHCGYYQVSAQSRTLPEQLGSRS